MKAEDWPETNRRRGQLIQRKVAGTINAEESAELDELQKIADEWIATAAPRPMERLEALEALLDRARRNPPPAEWYDSPEEECPFVEDGGA